MTTTHHPPRPRARPRYLSAALLCAAATLPVGAAHAYELLSRVIAGGGTGNATGGGYSLAGTIGQPVAGMSVGGGYTLDAGFWQARPTAPQGDDPIFIDDFED